MYTEYEYAIMGMIDGLAGDSIRFWDPSYRRHYKSGMDVRTTKLNAIEKSIDPSVTMDWGRYDANKREYELTTRQTRWNAARITGVYDAIVKGIRAHLGSRSAGVIVCDTRDQFVGKVTR